MQYMNLKKNTLVIVFLTIAFSSFGQNFHRNEGIIFSVSPVEKVKSNLPEIDYKTAIEIRTNTIIESYPITKRNIKLVATDTHACIAALHIAFAQHRPIVISPDMIWLMIIQGAGILIHENNEKLQNAIVVFDSIKQISIRRDDFIKGNENNDWTSVFPQFSDSIQKYMSDSMYDLFTPSFSTTTIIEKNAFEIGLMYAVDSYFDYIFESYCGIPEITLEGTTRDWKWIAENCSKLNKIGLSKWTKNLQPILNEFVNASEGKIDTLFWQSMYKWSGESGGPYITGWIIKFFPYIYSENEAIENPFIHGNKYAYSGLRSNNFPSGLSKVDLDLMFLENNSLNRYNMELYSGYIGILQDTFSKSLKPEIGWAIRDKKDSVYNNSEPLITTYTIPTIDTIIEVDEIYENSNLLDTLQIDYDKTDIWLHRADGYEIDLYINNRIDIGKYQKPILFPRDCNNYEESILFLEKYISKRIKKKINFIGKVSFNVTWYGQIDNVKIVESNRVEYNEEITFIIDEISACKPGIYDGKFANVFLEIDLTIK